ncbi:hypothetical protein HMPREF1138_0893 [Actinomyces sp. ICM58]|nr:hypothetical protein HMPREF1138_0893 [Actinomyces sp. ICM58]
MFDGLCLWDSWDDGDIPVLVGDIWVNRVQIVDHLLSGVGKASDLRHGMVAV